MTPESVLKAMAEALAERFTSGGKYDGRLKKYNKSLEERLDSGMIRTFADWDGNMSMRAVTPREAAVEAMDVVGPILELVWKMKDLLERSTTVINGLSQQVDDPGPYAQEILSEIWDLITKKIEMQEPADWDYVRRFSATPNEIHDILRSGLSEPVHLAYQQAIGGKITAEVAERLRDLAEESMPLAERINDPVNTALYEMVLRCADRVGRMSVPKAVVEP